MQTYKQAGVPELDLNVEDNFFYQRKAEILIEEIQQF